MSRAHFYRLLTAYRRKPQTSTLLPRRDGQPSGTQRLPDKTESVIHRCISQFYLTRVRPSVAALMRRISQECYRSQIPVPNYRTVKRRLATYDAKTVVRSRLGAKAANDAFRPVRANHQPTIPFQVLQIDHTPVDLIVVDDRNRLPIGRPWITLAIDVATRMVAGFYVSLESPSVISVALVLTHCVLPKGTWLADRGLNSVEWPTSGIPDGIHLDNAKEFHSRALVRGAQEYGIELSYRPPQQPHYGGHIERLIGTTMGAVHLLLGTTFENVQEKGAYKSANQAMMTLPELERWLAFEVLGRYHLSIHSGLGMPPLAAWQEGTRLRGAIREVQNGKEFFYNFLPGERRLIRRDGIRLFNIHYWSNVLSPLAGRSEKPALVKYDPRDLSSVYLRDESGDYWEIPYRDLRLPPISLWEHRAATQKLQAEGRRAVDEHALFAVVEEQRRIAEVAWKSTRERRTGERRRSLSEPQRNTYRYEQPSEVLETESSNPVEPFGVEEWE